jgi:hypothetical protein
MIGCSVPYLFGGHLFWSVRVRVFLYLCVSALVCVGTAHTKRGILSSYSGRGHIKFCPDYPTPARSKRRVKTMCYICDAMAEPCGWQLAKAAEDYFAGWEETACYACDEEFEKSVAELSIKRPQTCDTAYQAGDSALTVWRLASTRARGCGTGRARGGARRCRATRRSPRAAARRPPPAGPRVPVARARAPRRRAGGRGPGWLTDGHITQVTPHAEVF